jgi:hypothetical protein
MITLTKDSTTYSTKIDEDDFEAILEYEEQLSDLDQTINVQLRQMGVENKYRSEYPGYFSVDIPVEYDDPEMHKDISDIITEQIEKATTFKKKVAE